MRRRAKPELNINHERWLVSYADFVTLLFGFFVVMYSISQVSESKYRVLSATLTEVFQDENRSLEPIQVGEVSLSSEITPIDVNANQAPESSGAFDKTADLPQLSDQFTEQFSDLIDDEVIQVNSNEYWLQLSLNNSILFPLGSVIPSSKASEVIAKIATILRDFNNPIQVEGYTDNVAVNSLQFPSNWELSSARAASVVKLLADEGINPERLAAVGYGDQHPIAENITPEGRAQNRRVVLMIAREKMKRPIINTKAAVKEAVIAVDKEVTQVNPQPGLEIKQNDSEDQALSPKQKMDQLIDANPGLGIGTVLLLEDETAPETEIETGDAPPESQNPDNTDSLKPVETSSGGILFSSDPDLPRPSNE